MSNFIAKPWKAPTLRDRIISMLDRGARLSTNQIADRLGKRRSSIGSVMRKLQASGDIEICGEELHGVYVWRMAEK